MEPFWVGTESKSEPSPRDLQLCPLGRLKDKWEDNIKTDLHVGWGSIDWIGVAQDRDRRRVL